MKTGTVSDFPNPSNDSCITMVLLSLRTNGWSDTAYEKIIFRHSTSSSPK